MDLRTLDLFLPPAVSKPEGREQMQRRGLGPSVVSRDLDQQVLRAGLGVLDEQIEVPILAKDPGVDELILEIVARATGVGLDQIPVRERQLGVLVEVPHVGMGGRAVEIEVVLLDVLAVVPLRVREAEETLLEDLIAPVPEREREAQRLLIIGDAGQAVLTPSVRKRSGELVTEVGPGVALGAVVLAHRSPLALTQIRSPFFPGPRAGRARHSPRLCRHLMAPPRQ